ncbi:hypothetical protein BEN47_13135 [Hymenobacter lapidarius]|uniref:SnoaL-like domain-containing protein n=1 Tax=Hymenobacter lapidarius TaxID=1908237 RepID=A0A1G1T6J0_9BACT|nr:nuclear transport factor 2 family protein [Hymenobacter lapidarius]OGX86476.1 hypothetical protein BEN47_13135 [Hymenobacter lapidarius]
MRSFLVALLAVPALSLAAQAQTAPAASADETAVRAVLKQYQQAVEKLDTTGTDRLFAPKSQVFESGSAEGSYRHYANHHLGPELKEFSSFTYDNYKVSVQVDGPYAFATETYGYTIGLKPDPKAKAKAAPAPVERKGVATSVLRKNAAGQWQIVSSHNSARK